MRIAGNTVIRRYMHNLERNMGRKNVEENRLYSGRQFNRASENPIQAARALRVRRAIYDIESYQSNLNRANMIYEAAESSVMKVSSIIQSVYESLIHGAHGSVNRDDANIIAESIEQFAEEMVQLMNIVVADRRIFGGVHNSSIAFKIEDGPSGKIAYYHGIPLNQFQDPSLFPYSGVSYTDIGIGLNQNTPDGRVDPQSAIPVTFNGAEILGCGITGTTTSFNFGQMGDGTYRVDLSVGADRRTLEFSLPDNDTLVAGVSITTGGITVTVPPFTPPAGPPPPTADEIETARAMHINNAKATIVNQTIFQTFGRQAVTVGANGVLMNNVAGNPPISLVNAPPNPAGVNATAQASINVAATGFSGNVIQLVLDAAQALKADDRLSAAQHADALFALQTNVSLTIARIGNTQEFIEFNMDRTTNNKMTLLEQQKDMEASKPEEQITMIKVLEMLFNGQLQMGAQLIPMSIFNFIR